MIGILAAIAALVIALIGAVYFAGSVAMTGRKIEAWLGIALIVIGIGVAFAAGRWL